MRHAKRIAGSLTLLALGACSSSTPIDDPTPPRIEVTSPARGFHAPGGTVVVEGIALDDESGIESVTVNGVTASVDSAGHFRAEVSVVGTEVLRSVATDKGGNTAEDVRAALGGQFAAPGAVTRGLVTRIDNPNLAIVGDTVAAYVDTMDLGATFAGFNPVVDAGSGCFGAEVNVNTADYEAMEVTLSASDTGRLHAVIDATDLLVTGKIKYDVVCIGGSSNLTARADRMLLEVEMGVQVQNGNLIAVVQSTNLEFDGLDFHLGGLPESLIEIVTGDLEDNMAEDFSEVLATGIGPALDGLFLQFSAAHQVDVLGNAIDITLRPSQALISDDGLEIVADMNMVAAMATETGYVPSPTPATPANRPGGLELALADDAASQLLGTLWSTGALDQSLETAEIPGLSAIADRIDLDLPLPPSVHADGNADFRMVIGDALITLHQGSAQSHVALTAQLPLRLESTADGTLSVKTGEPEIHAVLMDPSTSAMTSADLDLVRELALALIKDDLDRVLGTLPLPTLAGTRIAGAQAAADSGYLMFTAELERDAPQ